MSDRPESSSIGRAEPRAGSAREELPPEYSLHEPYVDFWLCVGLGIVVALGIVPYGIFIANSLDSPPSSLFAAPLLEFILVGALRLFFGLTLSFFVTALAAAISIGFLIAFLTSLQQPHETRYSATVAAGLTALIVTIPITASATEHLDGCTWLIIAILIGNVGSSWGRRHAIAKTRRFRKPPQATRPSRKFQIQDLLVLTGWTAMLLTGLKLSGLFHVRVAVVLSVWVVTMSGLVMLQANLSATGHIARNTSQNDRST